MEMMTLSSPQDLTAADFSNRASAYREFLLMPILTPVVISLLSGPGAAYAAGTSCLPNLPDQPQVQTCAPSSDEGSAATVPARELMTRIKEGWELNMTELAELMGVQRPTLYNWLNGKTSPEVKLQKQLQTLAATAADWKEATAGSNWDFLLDYTGPRADEVSIRETLGRAEVSANEIRDMIRLRMKQYQEAYARTREILGEPAPIKGDPIRESTRKLNKRWTENAHRLHRARNSSR